MGAIPHRRFLANQTLFEQPDNVLVEGDHAKRIAGFHDFVKCFAFRLTVQNQVLDPQIGSQNFKGGHPSAPHLGQQPLGYDPAHGVGQADANLFRIFGGEHTQNTVYR